MHNSPNLKKQGIGIEFYLINEMNYDEMMVSS